jgi:nucleotide-binding universal stress UspA family protein
MPYGMVVVGTDGSDSALSAVERAAEISTASGAAVRWSCARTAR